MTGACSLIGGAALGAAFDVLCDILTELIANNVFFKPLLKNIKFRLDCLAPIFKNIEKSNKKLDLSGRLHLEEGIEVVMKYKNVGRWSLYKRYKYVNRLIRWDEYLQQLLNTLNVQGIRDMKDSSLSVRNMENVPSRIESNMVIPKQPDSEAWCSAELNRIWDESLSRPSPQALLTPKPESQPVKGQWQKGKLIGRGMFGSVYVATNRETGALCAMKEVELFPEDPKSAECIKQLQQEIKFLSQLKHPNIVQYYGSEMVDDRFFMYLEYVHPGSIKKYVHEHCGAMTEAVVRNFTRHILFGLAYLHSTKTIHRDIKGANLLVDSCGVVKLADFGMAKHLSGRLGNLSLKGSPYWMAPELIQAVMDKDSSSDLALAVDIWSLGCTIIEMFTGKPPWSEYEWAAAMFKVLKDAPPIPETLSPEGKDFLRCCFQRNPAERPTAAMLLEHRFLKTHSSKRPRLPPRHLMG